MTGWRDNDPLLRALRAIAVVAFIAMLFIVIWDPDRSENVHLPVLLFGAILIALGYPVVMRLPGITNGKRRKRDADDE